MKKLRILLLLSVIVFTGCGTKNNAQIAATTLPVYEFTSALCQGTELTVTRLVTENVSCLHDYSVQVNQMRAVESADVVVLNGAGLENFLADVLQGASHIIDASVGISLSHRNEQEEHHHHCDPHIWLSPVSAKQMCKTIAEELTLLYPQHGDAFHSNLQGLLAKLDALQKYGENALADLKSRELITFHDGFSYFAESFDLHILKAVEEESGSEASAKELTDLIALVQQNNLPAIFTEANGSIAAAEIISRETGAKTYTLNMAMSGNSYFDAMEQNINTIKEALE